MNEQIKSEQSFAYKIPDELKGKEFIRKALDHCIKCSTCKYSWKDFEKSCPSGEKFLFESFWASGRIRLIRGLIFEELEWNEGLKDAIFACPTCGSCMNSCQAPHAEYIVDMIEALRELAVKEIGPAKNQELLVERATNPEFYNPYGEYNSTNERLKREYDLPDKAEWVYYIGCTSNYRQQRLRDATLRLLKRIGIDFTLIDEHCCTSPMIRTGQLDSVQEFMEYNLDQIEKVGANKIITSCAGCYRTLSKDYPKFGIKTGIEIYHTSQLIKQLLDKGAIEISSKFDKYVTYHDPCHLGKHMGIYEIPREILLSVPNLKLVEMKRNRAQSWCCGAGGGVKIGYPEWAVEISEERIKEAKETGAEILSSMCPFCLTNLNDANNKSDSGLEIYDIVEILDKLDIKILKS